MLQDLSKWLSPPSALLMRYLIGLYLLGFWFMLTKSPQPWLHLWQLLALILGFYGPHLVWATVRNIPNPQKQNIAISLLILVLLAHNQMSVAAMFVLGLVAWLLKTLLRWRRQPLLNPAAAGFVGLYLVHQLISPELYPWIEGFESWWGVSFAPRLPLLNMSIAMLLTVPVGVYLAKKYHKLPIVMATFLSFALVYSLSTLRSPFGLLLEGTFAFFALVMVIEPRTSPNTAPQQWVYGGVVGSLLAMSIVWGWLPLPYTMSLILGNLGFKTFQYIQSRS